MSLVAGRFAYGARVSQPSSFCECLAEEISAQWRGADGRKQGLAPCGRRESDNPAHWAKTASIRFAQRSPPIVASIASSIILCASVSLCEIFFFQKSIRRPASWRPGVDILESAERRCKVVFIAQMFISCIFTLILIQYIIYEFIY